MITKRFSLDMIKEILPFLILVLVVFVFVGGLLLISNSQSVRLVEKYMVRKDHIMVSSQAYTFTGEKQERLGTSTDSYTNVVHFKEMSFGKSFPGVEYDKLVEGAKYKFFSFDRKNLYVIRVSK